MGLLSKQPESGADYRRGYMDGVDAAFKSSSESAGGRDIRLMEMANALNALTTAIDEHGILKVREVSIPGPYYRSIFGSERPGGNVCGVHFSATTDLPEELVVLLERATRPDLQED